MSSVPYIFAGNTGNIPLSELDDNFANVKLSVDYVIQPVQANITSVGALSNLSVTGNVVVNRNALISGNLTVTGNTAHGNIRTSGFISAAGNILSNSSISATGSVFANANIQANGLISATGNISTANNIFVAGNISAVGTISSNTSVFVNGNISASGNTVANVANVRQLNARFISVSEDIFVQGNATVNGTTTIINSQTLNIADKDIVVANNVSTSALIDGAGILAGNPTVAYIRYQHADLAWATANNFIIGANLSVTGNAFSSTAANGTVSNQIATTQFVANAITSGLATLGTISTQNANAVNITGGSIAGITDLAVTDGGTGASSFTANTLLVGNGSSSFQTISPATSGFALKSNGTSWSGQKLGLGMSGEIWNNVTGSRSFGVAYTNSASYPIAVSARTTCSGGSAIEFFVDGLSISNFSWQFNGCGSFGGGFVIVPPGSTYQLNSGQGLDYWRELY